MRRRQFLRHAWHLAGMALGSLAYGCVGAGGGTPGDPASSRTAPIGPLADLRAARGGNVLFIVIDDLNDWIEPLQGRPGIRTPNINRLAAMGLTFTRAYCSVPACGASRSSTLTGIAPIVSGLYDFADFGGNPRLVTVPTLPRLFRDHGYTTRGSGKIFHGQYTYDFDRPDETRTWTAMNQDIHAWHEFHDLGPEPRPPGLSRVNGLAYASRDGIDWGPLPIPDDRMPDWAVAEWAAERLRSPEEGPRFLAVGLYRPHLPWYVPKRYFDLYPIEGITLPPFRPDDLEDVPAIGQAMAGIRDDHRRIAAAGKWKDAIQAYCASITFADACIGRILDAIEDGRHARDTTIVLWSDNGFHLGEKLAWRKFTMWERANRVPLIIAPPGYALAGERCHRPVSLLDLYPTLADLCLGTMPVHANGLSLRPLLENPGAPWPHPAISSWRDGPDEIHHSVRTERHRFIRYADGSEELYDHLHDPNEWDNLLSVTRTRIDDDSAEIRNAMARLLPIVRPS